MNLPTLHSFLSPSTPPPHYPHPPTPTHTHLPQCTQCPAACQILRCSGHHEVPSGGEEQLQAQTVTVNSLCCSFWWFSHYHWFAVTKLPAIYHLNLSRAPPIQHSVSCCKPWHQQFWGWEVDLVIEELNFNCYHCLPFIMFDYWRQVSGLSLRTSRSATSVLSLGRDAKLLTHQTHK